MNRLTDQELRGLAEGTIIYCHVQGSVYELSADGPCNPQTRREFRGIHEGSTDWYFLVPSVPTDRFLTPGGAIDAALLWLSRTANALAAKRKVWGV